MDDEGTAVVPSTRVVSATGQSCKVKWSDNKEYEAVVICTGTQLASIINFVLLFDYI